VQLADVEYPLTLVTVSPVFGVKFTAVTPDNSRPWKLKLTVAPCLAPMGLTDVICGIRDEERTVKSSELLVPLGVVTVTERTPVAALADMRAVYVTFVFVD
jgi:hypothetical protein